MDYSLYLNLKFPCKDAPNTIASDGVDQNQHSKCRSSFEPLLH
jgi:hypothetical protein